MKVLLFLGFMLVSTFARAQQQADAVTGIWLTQSGGAKVRVFKSNDQYYGNIIWLKEPNEDGKPKLDKNNPDAKLRSRPVMNLMLLRGFKYQGNAEYADGKIYDPKNGKDYSCKMKLSGKDKLEVRGFIGISLLGRTETWTRVE